jgi:hypothetical protein
MTAEANQEPVSDFAFLRGRLGDSSKRCWQRACLALQGMSVPTEGAENFVLFAYAPHCREEGKAFFEKLKAELESRDVFVLPP